MDAERLRLFIQRFIPRFDEGICNVLNRDGSTCRRRIQVVGRSRGARLNSGVCYCADAQSVPAVSYSFTQSKVAPTPRTIGIAANCTVLEVTKVRIQLC